MFKIIILLILLFVFLLKFKVKINIDENVKIEIYILNKIKIYTNVQNIKKIEEKGMETAKIELHNYLKHIEFTDVKLLVKNLKKLLNNVKIDKLNFVLNINTQDYILNAYLITLINTVISIIITKRINQINTDELLYNITSYEKTTKFKLECIITAKFTDIIFKLIKVLYYIFKLKKRGNEKYGKSASNRKFNGNSNVFTRNNG
ncbi:MAG: hypothetical protein RR144_03020 [Clostridia bacterium]